MSASAIWHRQRILYVVIQGIFGVPLLCGLKIDQGPADSSLRPEEENGHADTMLYSTSCGAQEYVGE
jgi:hypothetical protein